MEEAGAEVPLLKGDYHLGSPCPGCAYDRKKELYRGLPYKEFLYLWMICLTAALPISSLFPFLYFMIRDLHVAKRTEDIGFYAGFVGASFMFGRCLTSTVWGMAADRIGRKPVVVFGIFAVVIFNTLFGLSFTYWMAIATRFLLGALNGLLGPIKAYAIEVCRPEHEALALSLVSTAWGIGLIIGPAIGGYLSQPAEKFPDVFSPDSLFARFPYFLPCLCISVFAAVVLVGCIWMPETLHKHKADANTYQTVEALESHLIDPKEKADQNGSSDCKKSLLSNWPLMSSIILYCVFSFHDMAYTEDINWSAAPDDSNGCRSADSSGGALCKQDHVNYPERPGRPECPFYMRFGDCKFASACKYHHSKDRFPYRSSAASDNSNGRRSADSSGGALSKQEHVNYPERPGRPECPFYTRFGDCKFASACKYHHSKDRFPSRSSAASHNTNGRCSADSSGGALCKQEHVNYPERPGRSHSNDPLQGEELVEYPERPGEPECPFYMKNGYCKFGVECKFHHTKGSTPSRWSPKDVKKPVAPKEHHPAIKIELQDHMCQQDQYPERPGQPDCRYYMQFGKCKYCSACIFHHPKDRLSNGWHPSESVLRQEEHTEHTSYPERPGELECFYYMRHGFCKFQGNCKYHHPKDRLPKKSYDPAFD